jgi:outer membrane autotransporter protein
LLATVSLLVLSLSIGTAPAQQIIDNGELVRVPGDRPNPWDLIGELHIGETGAGTLLIENGGQVSNTIGRIGIDATGEGTVAVTGSGSTWTNSNSLYVGEAGSGSLTIANGGSVSSSVVSEIGALAGSSGTVTVTGSGSTWTNHGTLFVGSLGNGIVTVENGGSAVVGDETVIGVAAGSSGTVTVRGAGSQLTVGSALTVGNGGESTLTIADGGSAVVGDGTIIGSGNGSSGTVTVRGAGSQLTAGASLWVGNVGEGTLTIADGGSVISGTGNVGYGSNSAVTVSGANSSWTNTDVLNVGMVATGHGHLTIENGGIVTSPITRLATNGGQGTLILRGTNGARGVLETGYVFDQSNGASLIFDGGILRATGTIADFLPGFADGEVVINGGGAFIDTNGFDIGFATGLQGAGGLTKVGNGTLTLSGANAQTGGTTINAGVLTFGVGGTLGAATSTTTVIGGTLDFSGTTQTQGMLVQSGGTVRSGTMNAGTYQLTGGTLAATATINAGAFDFRAGAVNGVLGGGGALTKTSSGTVTLAAANTYTGGTTISGGVLNVRNNTALGFGAVTVNGGALELQGGVTVGNGLTLNGTGVSNGGALRSVSGSNTYGGPIILVGDASIVSAAGTLAFNAGGVISGGVFALTLGGDGNGTATAAPISAGTLIKEGAGMWTVGNAGNAISLTTVNAGILQLTTQYSNANSAAVVVNAPGTLQVTNSMMIGSLAGGGRVTLQGPAETLTTGGDNNSTIFSGAISEAGGVGSLVKTGTGTFTLSGSSTYSGDTTVSGGALVVDGGSISHPVGSVFVGDQAGDSGTMTILNGGVVNASGITLADGADATGTLNIGAAAGDVAAAVGTLDAATVAFGAGTGTINFNHTGTGYEFASAISGNGTINQVAGTTVLTGTSSNTGATNVRGGTLLVNGTLGVTATTVVDGAKLGGSGSIGGDVTIADGGILAPGSSAGTLTLGSLSLNGGSILDYELGQAGVVGGGVNDLIVVTGDLALDGTLNITDIGGFGPGVYRLMNYGGALTDNGLELGGLPAGVDAGDLFVQTRIAGQVNLTNSVGAELGFWDGGNAALHDNGINEGGSGVWDATNRNWTEADGVPNGQWNQDFAIFGGAAGTVTVDDAAGGVFFTGMQFMTNGYVVDGDALTANTGETIIRTDAGVTATIAAAIDGSGGLVKQDTGTLILSGTNSYTGGTSIRNGTLQVSADANLGAASGGLTLDGGTLRLAGVAAPLVTGRNVTLGAGGGTFDTVDLDMRIAGDITGPGALAKVGTGTLTLTGANTYSGGTTINAGTLQLGNGGVTGSFAGDVDIANDGTLAFNRSDSFIFAGLIAGDGTVEKLAGGTLTLTGNSNAFAGTTTVNAGTLAVNGTLGGTLEVLAAARLQGTGTVGTTTVAAGGTIAPGSSIGTLRIAGDYTQRAGSTYEAEIATDGASDLIDVTGAATIEGGTVFAFKAPGRYDVGTRYTILTAESVTGTYNTLDQNAPFVDLALAYNPNAIYLDVTRNDVSFCDVAITANQCAIGDGLDSQGPGTLIYDAIVGLPDDETARDAFDQLSGEMHASIKGAILEDSRLLREAATARVRAAFAGTTARPLPVMGYGPEEALAREGKSANVFAPTSSDTDRFAVWVQGLGSWGEWDGDGNAAALDRSIGGLLIGADGLVTETWRLGVVAGYSHSSFDLDKRASSGDSNDYHLGLYGGTQWGALGFRAGAAYTWHSIETVRSVAFPGVSDQLSADYDAGTTQVFGELGYKVDHGSFAFEPFGNLAYVNVHTDGFNENGGAAALTTPSSDTDVTSPRSGCAPRQALVSERSRQQQAAWSAGVMPSVT